MKKQGFTLAEMLLCIGIIAVVAAMGATISKAVTQKAYNIYFVNGYNNLANAIADMESDITQFNSNNNNNNEPFMEGFHKRINNSVLEQNAQGQPFKVNADNGVSYTLVFIGAMPQNSTNLKDFYVVIDMGVPQHKTRQNHEGKINVRFVYTKEHNGQLIPVEVNNANYINLADKQNLLPTYVDDGNVGRRGHGNYTPIRYQTYTQSYCEAIDPNGISVPSDFLSASTLLTKLTDKTDFRYKNFAALIGDPSYYLYNNGKSSGKTSEYFAGSTGPGDNDTTGHGGGRKSNPSGTSTSSGEPHTYTDEHTKTGEDNKKEETTEEQEIQKTPVIICPNNIQQVPGVIKIGKAAKR